MNSNIKKNLIVIITFFLIAIISLQLESCVRESVSELWCFAELLILFIALIWANLLVFSHIETLLLRLIARISIILLLFVSVYAILYFYSWHIRPIIGLDIRPAWVPDT